MSQSEKGNVLGLINARGGSKGVPGKNIRPLCGKPLIGYAIESALSATTVNTVVVSTDDQAIANVAENFGARVPFIRPAHLATDTALQIDAIQHAVAWLESKGETFTHIVVIQPTTPFRTANDIDHVVSALIDSGADSAISVVKIDGVEPFTFYTLDDQKRISPIMAASDKGVLRQNFPYLYKRSGAVYAIRRDVVMKQGSLYGASTRGVELPVERSINIDQPFDWVIAEALMMASIAHGGKP